MTKEELLATEKILFADFLSTVTPEYQPFAEELNSKPTEQDCDLVIKEAKSGYMVSYQLQKKTIMNWVFRKASMHEHCRLFHKAPPRHWQAAPNIFSKE